MNTPPSPVQSKSATKQAKLLLALRHGNLVSRREAALKLGKKRDVTVVEPLCQALKDESWYVRRNAARSLGRLGDSRAIEPLCAVLEDSYRAVRIEAAVSLGRMGATEATPFLCRRLWDAKRSVRASAVAALLRIGLPSVAPLCQALLEERDYPGYQEATPTLRTLFAQNMQGTLSTLLTDSRLTPQQRYLGLEALRGQGGGLFVPAPVGDVQRFCDERRRAKYPEEVQKGARSVLEYLSLGRASQRDTTQEGAILLRAASAGNNETSREELLRASYTDSDVPSSPPTDSENLSLLERVKRLFGKS